MGVKHINEDVIKKRAIERQKETEIKELKQKLEDEQEKNITLEHQVL